MISVQELLNQRSPEQPGSMDPADEPADGQRNPRQRHVRQRNIWLSSSRKTRKRLSFGLRRQRVNRQQLLGLVSLGLGYGCLGWTLQVADGAPWIGVGLWAVAGIWGLRRSRHWHSLLPALISALALVSIMLPVWVMGLLCLPLLTFFGCVMMMKEQTLMTALLSSVVVYGLTLTAASLGAIALGITGSQSTEILYHLARIAAAFALLSLFPTLHRRRQASKRRLLTGQVVIGGFVKGQFAGVALAGLLGGALLSRVDWTGVTTFISQTFQ